MKKSIKNLSKKTKLILVLIAIGLVFLTVTLFFVDSFAPANPKIYDRWVLSTFFGSFDGDSTPNSYHQIEIQSDTTDKTKKFYTCVDTKVSTTNARGIKEIWLNISDFYEDELTVFISKGIDTKTNFIAKTTIRKKDIIKDEDGWFRIYYNESGLIHNVANFYGQIKVGFSSSVRLREMVIVDVEGELGTIEAKGRSFGEMPPETGVSVVHQKLPIGDAKNIADEQDTFSL